MWDGLIEICAAVALLLPYHKITQLFQAFAFCKTNECKGVIRIECAGSNINLMSLLDLSTIFLCLYFANCRQYFFFFAYPVNVFR